MAQRSSGYARKSLDRYFTPAWAVAALALGYPSLPRAAIEPCAGAGHVCAALEDLGFQVLAASDIAPSRGRRPWAGEIARGDALAATAAPSASPVAWITNPPFGPGGHLAARVARALVARAWEERGAVALLLPVAFDSGSSRRDLFADCPAFDAKVVLLDRIRWENVPQKANGPSSDHAWYVWSSAHDGPPSIAWVGRREAEAYLAHRERLAA